jgi:hypothetical protein
MAANMDSTMGFEKVEENTSILNSEELTTQTVRQKDE